MDAEIVVERRRAVDAASPAQEYLLSFFVVEKAVD